MCGDWGKNCIPSFSIQSEVLDSNFEAWSDFRSKKPPMMTASGFMVMRWLRRVLQRWGETLGKLKAFPFQPCNKLKGYA